STRQLRHPRVLRHGPGAGSNRLDDIAIAGAAANVALELFPNRRFVRFAEAAHDVESHHHHTRGAVPALQRMVLPKTRLHGMHGRPRWGQAFDSGDGCTVIATVAIIPAPRLAWSPLRRRL